MSDTLAPSRASLVWRDRIESGAFTRSECNAWAQTVGRLVTGLPVRRRSDLTATEADELMSMMDRRPRGVTLAPADTVRGLDWLHRYGQHLDTASGAALSCPCQGLPPWTPITFDGRCETDEHGDWITPVWTVYGPGGTFHYWWRSTWREDGAAGFRRPGGGFGEWSYAR